MFASAPYSCSTCRGFYRLCIDSYRRTPVNKIAAAAFIFPSSVLAHAQVSETARCSALKFNLAELIVSVTPPLWLSATFLVRLSHIWPPLLLGLVNKHLSCDAEPLSGDYLFVIPLSSPKVFIYFSSIFFLPSLIDMLLFLSARIVFASLSEACDLTFFFFFTM